MWHFTQWKHRVKLTLNNADTGGALTGHRTLVRLTVARVTYSDFQSEGEDIRFVSSGGVALPHHIAVWNTSGTSFIWVRISAIANDNNTYIYMYYGCANAPDGQDIGAVWSGYIGVWLFNEERYVFRDYSHYASDQWGDFGSPVQLGYQVSVEVMG